MDELRSNCMSHTPDSCTKVKIIEVKWCRYRWLSSGIWGQQVSLSRDSIFLSEAIYMSKWGQIRSIFDKLVRLSKFSPWTKIKIQGTKSSYCHASMTFFLLSVCARCEVHHLCQKCVFVLFLREMCVARDKLLCICFWESLFSVARLQTFLIGPWPWALILVIMT